MNGIDRITDRIEADAREQAKAIIAEAEAKCAEIRKENEKKAQERYLQLIRNGTKDCESGLERRKSAAEMDAKKSVLALKQDCVAEAFDMAKRRLADMPEDSYVGFLASLAASAAADGSGEIVLSARDRERCGKAVLERANAALAAKGLTPALTLAADSREISGGLILRQGGVEVNCSIEALVEALKGPMTADVARTLFE
ncbi:MAG: V-type ATP synthase subunit E [Oscillospiraceae bacterium]|nr:V-type ATP synthase subunit E [Oscillospiraceae bacterium]MCI6973255.1 V-type ATP synthase subunit E [Clostridiales bacterium]